MENEFNLSDTGTEDLVNGKVMLVFTETRVKEFIKRLKEELKIANWNIEDMWDLNQPTYHYFIIIFKAQEMVNDLIDKLAGDKLNGN